MSVTMAELRAWFGEHRMTEDTEFYVVEDGLSLCANVPGDPYVHCFEIGGEPEVRA